MSSVQRKLALSHPRCGRGATAPFVGHSALCVHARMAPKKSARQAEKEQQAQAAATIAPAVSFQPGRAIMVVLLGMPRVCHTPSVTLHP